MRWLRPLWAWIPAALKAAVTQASSQPDPEDDYPGRPVVHERPHLVPIGYLLVLTGFIAAGQLIDLLLMPRPSWRTFVTMWVPLAAVSLCWSAGLFIADWRARRRAKRDSAAGPS